MGVQWRKENPNPRVHRSSGKLGEPRFPLERVDPRVGIFLSPLDTHDGFYLYPMNSHQFSLVLLNIIAASSCFGLETIEFSRVLFLSCMSNQASSVRSIYLLPLKCRNFSIFMIEVCKKNRSYTASLVAYTR